jgi:hypothetical protein
LGGKPAFAKASSGKMKTILFILMISILMGLSFAQSKVQKPNEQITKNKFEGKEALLDFYRQYSSFTDPEEYAYLYKNLPDSLPELCRLIKAQIIHPFTDLKKYRNQIPKDKSNEDFKYWTVKSILKGLLSYDSSGFVKDRKPKERLVLGCRSCAILLVSILKYRGIPARVRFGFAAYLIPGFHANHVICEVWNKNDKRWMLVDPTTGMIDFSREKFDVGSDSWLKMQKGEINPDLYGVPGKAK